MAVASGWKVGDSVSFLPGPRSKARLTGTIEKIEETGTGKGRTTFAHIRSADNIVRKTRPGNLTAA